VNDFNDTMPNSGTSTLKKQTLKALGKKSLAKQQSKEIQKSKRQLKTSSKSFGEGSKFLILLKALDRVDFEDWKTQLCQS
jgi:hypothetical protein